MFWKSNLQSFQYYIHACSTILNCTHLYFRTEFRIKSKISKNYRKFLNVFRLVHNLYYLRLMNDIRIPICSYPLDVGEESSPAGAPLPAPRPAPLGPPRPRPRPTGPLPFVSMLIISCICSWRISSLNSCRVKKWLEHENNKQLPLCELC